MDDEEKELFGLTNSDEKLPPFAQTQKLPKSILALSKKMPSEEGKDDAGFSGCTDEQSKGKGNMTPSPRIDAQPSPRPQQDDSSNSDMRELKMMLGGGISDRSGN